MQEVINALCNALSRLYRLKAEGKKVATLIEELEARLFEVKDLQMDAERANEENNLIR